MVPVSEREQVVEKEPALVGILGNQYKARYIYIYHVEAVFTRWSRLSPSGRAFKVGGKNRRFELFGFLVVQLFGPRFIRRHYSEAPALVTRVNRTNSVLSWVPPAPRWQSIISKLKY